MDHETPSPYQVIVSSESGLAQEIAAGDHHFRSDEPIPLGTGSGPTPYDLLLAGLGSCTSMTLRLYAKRKGWDLQHVTIRLRHDRIHARDCQDCDTKEGFLDRIEREIEISGNLGADQKDRLLEIAEKCPVHRTLVSEIRIRTTVL